MPVDPSAHEVLTFDCYGTLIDWESGILSALRPLTTRHGIEIGDERILELYAELEQAAEAGEYLDYKTVLRRVLGGFAARLGLTPDPGEEDALVASVGHWLPFPDTVEALRSLKRRYKLAIVSNVDDDLFAGTAGRLEVKLDWVITARQVRAYKPSGAMFEAAIRAIGLPKERILHVAQSLFHDIVPAKQMGLKAVWVNRRHEKAGSGATPPAWGCPDLEVPDLKTLASTLNPG